jgi:hypothetical protein
MENFVIGVVPEGKFRKELITALNRRKPFCNFKWLIDGSDYRKDWFVFKMASLEELVREILNGRLPDREVSK